MRKILLIGFIVILIFTLFFGGIFLYFINSDFIGDKNPSVMKENTEAFQKTLLTARYFSKTELCEIVLSDSSNIRISVGNNEAYTMIFRKYYISGDTIIIKAENENIYENQELEKYINSNRMLVKDNDILFNTNEDNQFNKSKKMKIEFNNLSF